jgi:lipid-A-disaccharide synthase
VPQVVCYKGSWVSYQIAKRLVKVKYISLVNLIMDKEVVKELIQDDLTVTNVTNELKRILHDEKEMARMKKDYSDLKALLHQQQPASSRAAEEIINFLSV